MLRPPVAVFAVAATLAAALLVGGVAPAGAGDRPPVEAPASIPSDCSVDVTGPLNAWVGKQRKDATLLLRKDGCYRLDGTLQIFERKHFTLDGNGATLRAVVLGAQSRRHVMVQDGKDITIRNLAIVGPHTNAGPERGYIATRAFQHGFALQGVNGALLENVSVTNVFGDFVYMGVSFQGSGAWTRDVRVTKSRFDGSGRQGISITSGKRIRIDHNTIGRVGLSLIDLEANTPRGGALDVRIDHNETGTARHFWLANKGTGTQIGRIRVDANRMVEPTGALVFVYGTLGGYRGPFVFEDNHFLARNAAHDEGSKGAFFLSRARDVTIRRNTVTFSPEGTIPVVESRDSLDIVLQGNTYTGAGQEMITTQRKDPPRPAATAPKSTATTRPAASSTTAPRTTATTAKG